MNSKKRTAIQPKNSGANKTPKKVNKPLPDQLNVQPTRPGVGKVFKKSEAHFGRIIDGLLESCMIIGFDWTYLYLNEVAAQHSQNKRENLIGRTIMEMYPGVEKTAVFKHYRRCMEKRIPQQFEQSFTFADGTKNWYRFNVEPVPEGIFVLSLDITESKMAELRVQAALAEEERFREALDHLPAYIYMKDPQSRYVYANQHTLELFGCSAEELTGSDDSKFFPPETAKRLRNIDLRVFQGEQTAEEIYVDDPEGGRRVYWEVKTPIYTDPKHKTPWGLLGISTDITESKKTEELLREAEQRYKLLFESAPLAINITRGTEITYANPSYLKMFGLSSLDELKALPPMSLFTPEHRPQIQENIQRRAKGLPAPAAYEAECLRKDGTKFPVLMYLTSVTFVDGPATVGFILDVSESKLNEVALRQSEEKFRVSFMTSMDGFYWSSMEDGKIIEVNPVFEEVWGYTREEAIGKTSVELGLYQDPIDRAKMVSELKEKGRIKDLELKGKRKDGRAITISLSGSMLTINNQSYILGSVRDITNAKRAEEALLRQSQIMDQVHEGIVTTDLNGLIVSWNHGAERQLGYSPEEALGKPISFIYPQDQHVFLTEEIQPQVRKKGWYETEVRFLSKSGKEIPVQLMLVALKNAQGVVVGMTGSAIDITERKRAEQQREILYQVLRAMSSQLETEHVARSAVETFVRLTGYPHVCIALPDAKRAHWAVRAAAGNLAAELGATYPIHKGVIGNAFKTGQTQWVRDVLKDPHYVNDVKAPGGPALRSEFVALMRRGDNLLGALNVESDHADAFDEADARIIQSVADIISLSLQNAKLFEEAQQEINERKRAEQALQESEKRFRVIFEKANDGIAITRENNEIVDVNPRMCAMLGYSRAEFLKMKVPDLQAPEVRQSGDVLKNELARHGNSLFEGMDVDRSGRRIPIEISVGRVELPSGEFYISVLRDITERKQTQTLQEAVYRIAAAAETTRSLEDLYPQIHQIIASVMPAENFYITLYDETQNLLRFPYFKDAEDEPFVGGIQPAKGLTAYVLRTGKSLLCTQAVHDELERRGEVKLLGVASAIWLGVPLVVEGKTIGAMVVQHYSDPKAYGEREQHMLEFVSTQVAIAINRMQAEEEIRQLNASLEKRVEERTRELRQAQDKIVRQEKLAMLGQLAGGVGHELRNPLGIISNAIYFLKFVQPDAEEKVKQYHAMIEQEVRNSEKIINDLLDFARLDSTDREPVAVRELVQRTLARSPIPEAIKTTLNLPESLPKVFVDIQQMEQVLGNLTVNACQAMVSPRGTTPLDLTIGAVKRGELTISAQVKNEMVAIAVKDTGAGISPENIGKIFEPLFTTKAKGIGLGLAVSRKLAEANGGQIEVKSELGKGSTFTLFLPVAGK